jgi:DNA gyrase subunit A
VVLNQLYQHTALQSTFGINMVALVNNQPRVLNLKKILRHFLNHRHDVVVNRTRFELRKAEERAHILEGLKIALDHLDEVIALIRASENPEAALSGLMGKFGLSKLQGQAILEMRLQRLTGLERGKIVSEHEEIIKTIAELKGILASDERIYAIIRGELIEIGAKFADPRKTEITESEADISLEDLITEEQVVVTISQHGYIKRNSISEFRSQRRGGKGMIGMTTKEEDLVKMLFVCSTHDYMLFFTTRGRLFREKVYQIPEGARATKGKAVVNLLMLEADELVSTFLNIREFAEGSFLTLITKNGVIKRTPLSDYKNVRARGIFAINLDEGDSLVAARITDGTKDIVVTTRDGLSARFPESEARSIGRTARGVKAIELLNADEVVSADAVDADGTILTITEQGYGKRTPVSEHPVHHRGGKGVITIKTSERNGKVVRALQVDEGDEIMVIAHSGKMIRTRAADVSVMSRNTQGVRIMDLDDDDRVVSVDGFAEVEFSAATDDTGGVEDDA